jgi:glycosyltransferase involved in cell wall biosynthesis
MINSMNVLFLANLNPNKFGSLEEHALLLSRELSRRGHVCYLGFIAEPEPAMKREFEDAGARFVNVYCGDTFKFSEMISLYRIIRENKIDLVHINFVGLTNPFLWGIYLTGVKIVFTEHASGVALARGPLKHAVSMALHYLLSSRISKYIAVSNYVRHRLRQTHHVSGQKTVTIYNGVNLQRFKPQDSVDARRELGFPLDRKIICSVAMLIPEKGIQHLVRAAALLVHKHHIDDIMVILVGEGHYREVLEQLVDEMQLSNHVLFLGRRSDVQTIITAADIVVVPSIWEEAFGLIIAEAMACARPVVASNIGGIPELVDDWITGKLVRPGDSEELAQAIHSLYINQTDRDCMGRAGLSKAEVMFNLARQVEKLIGIYNGICETP